MSVKTLTKLRQAAEGWRSFSQEANGWQNMEYLEEGIRVWCYFAADSCHTSISINDIRVAFHATPQFSGLTIHDYPNLNKLATKAINFLNKTKRVHQVMTEDQKERERQRQITSLEGRLLELKTA